MLLVPYQVDVPMARWPVGNFVLLAVTLLVSVIVFSDGLSESTLESMILNGWSPTGMFGYMLLHADWLHLIGNMIFLWVFGNAVCAKIGNRWYPAAYIGLGLLSATVHNLAVGGACIGASGAINGIIGMFLVWYPRNTVNLFYWFFVRFGRLEMDSRYIILIWFAFDLWGAASSGDGVAYFAHVGGFAGGVTLASILLLTHRVAMTEHEESLLDLLRPRRVDRHEAEEEKRNRMPTEVPPPYRPFAPPQTAPDPTPVEPQPLIAVCSCGKSLKVHPQHAGKRARCPACSAAVQIPSA